MNIKEYQDISKYTTFGLSGKARCFLEIGNNKELEEGITFAEKQNLPVLILGAGSNTILGGDLNMVVLKLEIKGIEIISNEGNNVSVKIGGGESWDNVVAFAVDNGLRGIEAMSLIPGTAGATPVQNVGAYGQEIKDTLEKVEVYDLKNKIFTELKNEECCFGYRDSLFKSKEKGRYVIVSIVLNLKKDEPDIPNYPDVIKYFTDRGIDKPTLTEIRKAIIEIRQSKLPDSSKVHNAGSFFKNPVVDGEKFEYLKEKIADLKYNEMPDGTFKIPAGFLIEKADLKGYESGKMAVSEKNALVLINKGGATIEELLNFVDMIQKKVHDLTGIMLEIEPNIIY